MQNVIDKIEWMFAGLGGFLGWFFGGFDGFLYALVVFVVCDYFTGVLAAAIKHELSSEVGFKGIAKKVCIFVLVGIANIIDTQILQNGAAIRTAVVFFYLANEGLSCLENAAVIGLPVPDRKACFCKHFPQVGGNGTLTFIRLAAGQKDLAGIFTAEFNINTKSVHRFGNCIGQLRKIYIKLVHYFLRPLFLPRLRCCSSSRSIT